jgi:hypothetical protein
MRTELSSKAGEHSLLHFPQEIRGRSNRRLVPRRLDSSSGSEPAPDTPFLLEWTMVGG